ncbi:MAG: hypothetical protein SPE74_06335 [Oscillospiraceae bacterium]|nr:hypothetical protein [bacterium]MDY5101011.1 hypothetical protein [Oscillospiraceae bacterium]
MAGFKDELEYIAFCKKLLERGNEIKNDYQNLSPDNQARLRSQALELLRTSGLAEMLGIPLD